MNEITTFKVDQCLFNVEAEQQLLGAILTNNAIGQMVGDILTPDHFHDPVHADLYRIARGRIAKGHLVSPVTLKTAMADHAGLKEYGGPSYLVRLAGASISGFAAPSYAGIIVSLAARRTLHGAVSGAATALVGSSDIGEVVSGLQHVILGLPEASGSESSLTFLRAATEAITAANEIFQGNTSLLKTGTPLDKVLRGLSPGDLCLIGGATSMGKTSLALEIAANIAAPKHGTAKGVAFVSLEMQPQDLANRMISRECRIPYEQIRAADEMAEADFIKWCNAAKTLEAAAIRIIPKGIRDIPAIDAAVRRARAEFDKSIGLHAVIVDYAQLVRGEGKGRYEQLTNVSIGLKTIAGLVGVPVIALCQLSRDIAQRENKRPSLSDIKETGQFENDADQVVFTHREGYWLRRQGPKRNGKGEVTPEAKGDWEADVKRHENRMELIVQKNRHGKAPVTVEVGCHIETNRFWPLDDEREMM